MTAMAISCTLGPLPPRELSRASARHVLTASALHSSHRLNAHRARPRAAAASQCSSPSGSDPSCLITLQRFIPRRYFRQDIMGSTNTFFSASRNAVRGRAPHRLRGECGPSAQSPSRRRGALRCISLGTSPVAGRQAIEDRLQPAHGPRPVERCNGCLHGASSDSQRVTQPGCLDQHDAVAVRGLLAR